MLEGLSKLLAGEFGINGLLLGGLLIVFGLIIIWITIHLSRKKKKRVKGNNLSKEENS